MSIDFGEALPSLISRRAAQLPDEPFLHDVEGGSLTYAAIQRDATGWAEALSQAGLVAGGAVASMLRNCVEHYPLWLGIGWLRGLEVPINTELRGAVLHHVLASARVEILVLHREFAERVFALESPLPDLRIIVILDEALGEVVDDRWTILDAAAFLRGCAGDTEFAPPQVHDIASVLYTSGTTGPSKGVLFTWGQLNAGSVPTVTFATNDGADRFYAAGSPSHVVSKGAFASMALTRGQLFVRPAFSLSEFWADVERFGIRSTVLVGAMADFLLTAPPSPGDAATTLTNVLMVPVTPRYEEFIRRFGVRLWTAYNMTEISVPFTSTSWTLDDPLSCGRLRTDYPYYEARIVDEFDHPVATGDVGELIVRTAEPWTLNSGYLNMPEATVTAWRNGWFHTGDAFRVDDEGRYYFVDRMKDTIRRRGENISSFEVEAAVTAHPDVAECAAVAVPADEVEGEIKVVVVLSEGARLTAAELIEFLVARVPRYMVPRYVQFADQLPKTQTLRVQKAGLRAMDSDAEIWDRQHPS
jgi:crotonobetaine/carnitine-CoA ligase